jgi:hypothetical protein
LFSGHQQIVLENVALRHQLAVCAREKKRHDFATEIVCCGGAEENLENVGEPRS